MKKFLNKAIKENWYKHFIVALVVQLMVSHFFTDFKELRFFEQIIVAALFWYIANMAFEWIQKYVSKHKAGMKVLHYDSLAAVAGGVLAVLIYTLF